MAEERISKNDIFEPGLLTDIIKQAKDLEKVLKENLAVFSDMIKNNPYKSVEDVKKYKAATQGIVASSNAVADAQKASKKATDELNDSTAKSVAVSKKDKEILDDVNGSLEENIKLQTQRKEQIKILGEEQKNLNKQLKIGQISQSAYVKSTARLSKQTQELKIANNSLLFTIKAQIKEGQAASTSFNQQAQRLGQLRTAYRKLNEEQRNNEEIGGSLLKSIKVLDTQVKKNDASIGNFQRNVGNYSNSLKGAIKNTGLLDAILSKIGVSQGQLNTVQQGFSGAVGKSTGALKLFRVALASTGIGLLVVALGSIAVALTSSEEGMNKFNKALAAIGIVIGNISDVLAEFGDQLISFFSGDGFDNTKLLELLENFGEETEKEIKRQNELSDIRAENLKLQRELVVATAKGEKEIAELRLKARDIDKFTAQQRIEFLERATKIELDLLAKELALAERKNELAQSELEFNRSGTDELNAAAEAEADLFRLQTRRFTRAKELQSELNRARKQGQIEIGEDVVDDEDEGIDAELAREAESFKVEEEANKKRLKEEQKFQDEMAAIADEAIADDIEKTEEAERKKAELRKKQIEEAQQLITNLSDSLDKVSDKRIEKIEREQEANDKAIEEQQRRAEQGLSNTLAFEQQKQAELEKSKEEEQKKAERRAKVLAYLSLFTEFSKENPNTAAGKALAQVAVAETVSGLFYEGTEKVEDDIAGKPLFPGRDGYVIRVDGSERIMTGAQNNRLGGISNEDLVSIAEDSKNPQVIGIDSSGITQRLDMVIKAVQSSGVNVQWDGLENRIETKVINGVKKITHHKRGRI